MPLALIEREIAERKGIISAPVTALRGNNKK